MTATASEDAPKSALRYGQLMGEVGRRFELLGRAAAAEHWELAAYALDELEEALEELPASRGPRNVGDLDLRALERTFADTHVPELRAAIGRRDRRDLAAAFDAAAATCNGCHEQARHAFIVINPVPGSSVPDLASAP